MNLKSIRSYVHVLFRFGFRIIPGARALLAMESGSCTTTTISRYRGGRRSSGDSIQRNPGTILQIFEPTCSTAATSSIRGHSSTNNCSSGIVQFLSHTLEFVLRRSARSRQPRHRVHSVAGDLSLGMLFTRAEAFIERRTRSRWRGFLARLFYGSARSRLQSESRTGHSPPDRACRFNDAADTS